ncbi:MAG: valine--tRNA ligase [bacterium]|nr:MAG: valine--tRNA ligase [bacterium]
MDSKYNHNEHEEKIYSEWEKSDSFKPNGSKQTFSITLPPPNANAALHYGHAMYTVEDVLIRYHRMKGFSTLWIPGADHAGFETQVVYEKHLEKIGKSRFDFDRDTLYKDIFEFVQGNRGTMENQLKRLGFSLDWSNIKFTLDDSVVKVVHKTFKKLYDDELVYRDIKLVNYCTKHGTAFSDLEVEHIEKMSKLYFVKYKIENENDYITVATTRPETIFGDSGICVNPKDKRYKKFVGKKAINPLNGRVMPIFADEYVKMDFGTGALKVTPLHDENDFLLGKKHNLENYQVIDFRGKFTKEAGEFEGQKASTLRDTIVEKLQNNEHLEKVEEFNNSVGTCYKCGNTLEPLPMEQWFIKTKELAKPAIKAVEDGHTKIIPKRFEKIYFNWLKNIRDWNISRQIVWGIRIPAWKNTKTGEWTVTDGQSPKGDFWEQDKDTFDTWFSSGQWPFATLNYPEGELYKKYYPLSVMETGYDILFFWVARMMMLGIYVTGKVPFKNIYLHGIVRDSKGQKMSKSKGNVINPLEIVEKYGADSLRMSLIAGAGAGNDQNYSEEKVRGYRNFGNKIWNAARFVKDFKLEADQNKKFDLKIKSIAESVTKSLEKYNLNKAAETVYEEFWHWYCDEAIEEAKAGKIGYKQLKSGLFVFLKLLHPFMPFVTEACWKELGNDTLLLTESWPKISNGQDKV